MRRRFAMHKKKMCIVIGSLFIFSLLMGVSSGAPAEKGAFIVAVGQDVPHVDPHKVGAAGADGISPIGV